MISQKLVMLRRAREARENHNKGYLSQLSDIIRLRFGFSALGPADYYQYELYDDSRYPFEDKISFLGWRGQIKADRALNDSRWHFSHSDKVISTLLLERLQIPTPRIHAVFDLRARYIPNVRYLTTAGELEDFLSTAPYPVFVKPVDNALGRGALRMNGFDSARRAIALAGGNHISVTEAYSHAKSEAEENRGGLLYQECVESCETLGEITGGRLSSLRMIVVNAGQPELTHAIIKFPTGSNIIDNFRGGTDGNLVGRVGLMSGTIEAVFGVRDGRYVPFPKHPDTGSLLPGVKIKDWDAYRELTLRAASCFPGMKLQHWDVAISRSGPKILELNADGCVQLPQVAYQKGVFSGAIKKAYELTARGVQGPAVETQSSADESIPLAAPQARISP